jgi:alpha-1,2-mannosyltransferase
MIIGIFSPVINRCGGAEWVAINIINSLKEQGHRLIVLTDEPLNQQKFIEIFNRKVSVDQQIIFPLRFFSPTNYRNIYTDALRSFMLKLKCDLVVDTFSNAVLAGMNAAYIHHPLLRKIKLELPHVNANKIFFYPYQNFLNFRKEKIKNKLIFANSKFTANAVKAEFGLDPYVLYPPVSNDIFNQKEANFDEYRDNNVVTIARITTEKNLEIIPHIAKLTGKDVSFTIVGLLDSKEALNSLVRLIKDLKLSERIRIITNAKRNQLVSILLNSKVFLHTKVNEHFGISVIEAMSSGCIPIVHDSGGPREFVPKIFRYNSIEEAAEKVEKAKENWSPNQARELSRKAAMFDENHFSMNFIDIFNTHFAKHD